jgi:hypothetical protein
MGFCPYDVPCQKTALYAISVIVLVVVASGRAAEPFPKGTLSGRVIDADGKPVATARVWAEDYDGKTLATKTLVEARTDAEGRFRLGPVEPIYRLKLGLNVEADGFARLAVPPDNLSIAAGCDHDLGTLQLDLGRVFTGQVIDSDGKPLPNAEVKPRASRNTTGHAGSNIGASQTLRTDADGRFRTAPLPVGLLYLVVRAPERQQVEILGRPIPPGGEEDMGAIRLEEDVPIVGVVRDEDGAPVAGGEVFASGHRAKTGVDGRFTLRGFGPNPSFSIHAAKVGYSLLGFDGRSLGTFAGGRYQTREGAARGQEPARDLVVTLRRGAWIEGQAVDAETGEPVRLDKVVVCKFERKPSGEVVLRGCRSDFEQSGPGRFRVSFADPDEYHLAFTAAGYHDAEAFTPKVTELKTISGVVARMKRKTAGSAPVVARQTIAGAVTRDGRPVQAGWVGLWALRRPSNAANAPVMRGRTAVGPPIPYASAPIRDGSYSVDVPFQSETWYVVAEEPGQPVTQVGPIAIALNQNRTADIACTPGGRIRGRVEGVPPAWEGHVWVVAFSRTAVRDEVRVARDGTFTLPPLPAGEYGLKAGHDAYDDPEVYPGPLMKHPEAFKETADPWKRAKVVKVEAGRDSEGAVVDFPP